MTYKTVSKSTAKIMIGLSCAAWLSACASGGRPDYRPSTPQDNLRSGGSISAVRPAGLLFASMDRDGRDGLDRSELAAGIAREWAVINSGVKVSAIDFGNWSFGAMGSREAMPNFLTFDTDFNGGLTQKEFENGLRAEFDREDKNKDGRVTRDETTYLINMPRQKDTRPSPNDSGVEQTRGRPRG